jgi:hypothetical protein
MCMTRLRGLVVSTEGRARLRWLGDAAEKRIGTAKTAELSAELSVVQARLGAVGRG